MSGTQTYLLLDSWSRPVAKGVLLGPEQAQPLRMKVLDGRAGAAAEHEIVQLVGIDDEERPLKCRLLGREGDALALERLEVLAPGLRKNLRIPVCFESFLYPLDGAAGGRAGLRSVDLSCGGIAFYSADGLAVDAAVEIVIPITEQPLIVRGRILRVNALKNGRALYAAKFVDLCHDEETMLRRAVFGVQIRNEPS